LIGHMAARTSIKLKWGLLSPEAALESVKFLAADSKLVGFTDHALVRMEERDIFDVDVFRVLKNGRIKGSVSSAKREGECLVKIVDKIKGQREVGVVTVIIRQSKLLVITVEWEDL
jgi:Domain of unknown function (DUF4258)